jgi:large subunit ribosomal protein L2
MGKRLIHQRRGRGTPAHRVASHRFKDKIRYRSYDALEKEGSLKGTVIDIVHDPARTAPIAEVKFENGEKKYEKSILLVDDTVDSRFTLTVCGYRLYEAGFDSVTPFALATKE